MTSVTVDVNTSRKEFDAKELRKIDRTLQKEIRQKFGEDVQIKINHNTEAPSGDGVVIDAEAYGIKKTEE